MQGRGPLGTSKDGSMIFQKRKTDLKTRKIADYLKNILSKEWALLMIRVVYYDNL